MIRRDSAKRILITGSSGFVGRHLVASLHRSHPDSVVIPTAKDGGERPFLPIVQMLDVTDRSAVDAAIARYKPTGVIHLAGIAAPSRAACDPDAAWRVHVDGTLHVAHAILEHAPSCAMLFVGSGLVYGATANSGRDLDEGAPLAPLDVYSASKAAADVALGVLARQGLKCVRLRPFNHTGPGQSEAFVIPAFAMQIARIEAGLQPSVLRVGNLDAQRDFLDVRDVVRAYALAAEKAAELPAGVVLNVASGIGRRVDWVLEQLVALSTSSVTIEQDTARMRPTDLPRVVGNPHAARTLLDWTPQHAFEQTLADVLADCRARVLKTT